MTATEPIYYPDSTGMRWDEAYGHQLSDTELADRLPREMLFTGPPLLRSWKMRRGYLNRTPTGYELMSDAEALWWFAEEKKWRRSKRRMTRARLVAMFLPAMAPTATSARLDAQAVKESCDPVAVYLSLGGTPPRFPSRDRVQVVCLVHDDHSPSATLFRKDTGYHCFTCQAHFGDIYSLVMAVLGISFPEAVKYVGEICL